MTISFDPSNRLFRLEAGDSTYAFMVHPSGALIHLYYGSRISNDDLTACYAGRLPLAFSPNPREYPEFSRNDTPTEFGTNGIGDFSLPTAIVRNSGGDAVTAPVYRSHRIFNGKPALPGLPASFADDTAVQTLEITLCDSVAGIEYILCWSAFEDCSAIARSMRIRNCGDAPAFIEKAASCTVGFCYTDMDFISFTGAHARERDFNRLPIVQGIHQVGTPRGFSSHQANPFVMLAEKGCSEEHGNVMGAMLVYSGSWLAEVEQDQQQLIRFNMGINPRDFRWYLAPGEEFQTPEVVTTFSANGFDELSRTSHDFISKHIIRSPWKSVKRPILINNWEAMTFNFDHDKLMALARTAAANGIEMMVLDDGWFGKRDNDLSGLGDWKPNEKKLSGTISDLAKDINALGMKFGLWFEPEMISEDSDLFRAHPDWALQIPGRDRTVSRFQLVLDFTRPEVVDAIYEQMAAILSTANIEYVKWDANRHLSEAASQALPPERRGETLHRYMLGLYDLQERLVRNFPNLLVEGCSGGGGRFDAGMLYYFPQIWCSDNTDAIDRLKIQYGTSFAYPPSSMGAHVAKSYTATRSADFQTRANVAMAGTFGYELDLNHLDETERSLISGQCRRFHEIHHLIDNGVLHRLTSPFEDPVTAWLNVARDKSQFLLTAVQPYVTFNTKRCRIRLRGLDADAIYRCENGERHSGDFLMKFGWTCPVANYHTQSWQLLFTKE